MRIRVMAFTLCALTCLLGLATPVVYATAIPVSVTVPAAGQLSLGIYNSAGVLVRSLAYARTVGAGQQTFTWDATTDLGLPVAPGNYQVHGVAFPSGPQARFVMKVGLSGTPPYPSPDGLGSWGGNLGAAMDICGNGQQMIAIFGCVEDNYCTGVQLMDGAGKIQRRYNTFFPWDCRFAGAMDDKHFYLADAALGDKRLVVAKYDLNKSRGKILTDIPGGAAASDGRWAGRWTTDVRGMALGNGRLYVPVLPANTLHIVDPESGAILQSAPIPSPRGVAVKYGQVYQLSGNKLLRLDADGKVLGEVISTGLSNPSGITISATDEIFITDDGDAQQVKVFSLQGKPLRKIGLDGGRPENGLYNPRGMRGPRGICLGPDGAVWVTEQDAFQRVSKWDAKTGALTQEFFNCRISSGQGRLSADGKTMVFTNGVFADDPGIRGYTVDLRHGTWYPAWNYDQPMETMAQPAVFRGFLHGGYPLIGKNDGHDDPRFGGGWPYLSYAGTMLRAANGHTYLMGGEGAIYLFDDPAKPPKLAAFVYTHRVEKPVNGQRYVGDYDQGPNNWLTWSDRHGDGQMTLDECTCTENPAIMAQTTRLFGTQLQPDLSIVMLCPDKARGWVVRRLPAKDILPSGVPVYDWADVRDMTVLHLPAFIGGDGWKGGEQAVLNDIDIADGVLSTYAAPRPTAHLRLPGVDGDGWWASRNWRLTPLRFDLTTGEPIGWQKLGRRAPGRAKPGEMYYPNPARTVNHTVFVPDTFAQMWVWTDDGLYLGRLYNEQWEGKLDANSIFVELTGAFVYAIDGQLYACTGDHGVSVHQVELPPLTPVKGPALTVTPEMAAAAKPWDPDGPVPEKKPVYVAQSIYDYQTKAPVRTITVDGDVTKEEWDGVAPMVIERDGKAAAEVRALWDHDYLYLAYTVHDANGFRNAGTELPTCPFVSGSYVDFCLGTEWKTPQREDNLPGDVRVILANITGQQAENYQMGFWPLKAGGKHPQTIKSPAASRAFDDIAPLPGVSYAVQPTADGYTLEASIPFKALGFDPVRNYTVGFDASVAFANAAGNLRIDAAHWAGQHEATVVDRPGSSALLPATWGTLYFDRTPVKPTVAKEAPAR